MGDPLSLRVMFATAVVSSALVAAGLISYPVPISGAGLSMTAPAVTVNRALKGDRLPTLQPAIGAGRRTSPARRVRTQIPLGCERAFSPVASPRLAAVYRRCMV